MRLQVVVLLLTVSLSMGHENCHPPSEKKWICNGQGFTGVPQTSYSIEVLNLSTNNLTELTDNSFQKYNELIELYLSDNTLNKIDVGAFRKLADLTYVDLSSNNLTYIHPCTFYLNLNLEKLLLQHNPLHHVDPRSPILKSTSLQVLDLRFVALSDFDIANFADLSSLNYLYLSYNTSKEASIRNITTLFTFQYINTEKRHHCDLTVTWQSDADDDIVQYWNYSRNISKEIYGCTEDRITTIADTTIGSSLYSEEENESENPTTEIVTIMFTDEQHRTNATDTATTHSTAREPEDELSDWWLEDRFSLKDYLIMMSILFVCVIIGLFITHHLVVRCCIEEEEDDEEKSLNSSRDSITGHIYERIN